MDLIISKHAKERYAERVKDKSERIDITRYIAEHEEQIIEDIGKMIEFGELIYTGKNPRKDKYGGTTHVDIYINGTWVILINPDKNTVITLWKLELGLGEALNKQYAKGIAKKLKDAKNEIDKRTEKVIKDNESIKGKIADNDVKIAKYKDYIKTLEYANEAYKGISDSNLLSVKEAEDELFDTLEELVSK